MEEIPHSTQMTYSDYVFENCVFLEQLGIIHERSSNCRRFMRSGIHIVMGMDYHLPPFHDLLSVLMVWDHLY